MKFPQGVFRNCRIISVDGSAVRVRLPGKTTPIKATAGDDCSSSGTCVVASNGSRAIAISGNQGRTNAELMREFFHSRPEEDRPEPVAVPGGNIKFIMVDEEGTLWVVGHKPQPTRVGVRAETPPEAVDRFGRKYEFNYTIHNHGDGDNFSVYGIARTGSVEDQLPYFAIHFPVEEKLIEFELEVAIPPGGLNAVPTFDGRGVLVFGGFSTFSTGDAYNFISETEYAFSGTGGEEEFFTLEVRPTKTKLYPSSRSGANFSVQYPLMPFEGFDVVESTQDRSYGINVTGQNQMYWQDSEQLSMENQGYRLDLDPSMFWDVFGGQHPNVVKGFGYDVSGAIIPGIVDGEVTIQRVALTDDGVDEQKGEQFQEISVPVFLIPDGFRFAQGPGGLAGVASYHPGG